MQVTDYSMIAQLTKEFLGSGASAAGVLTCLTTDWWLSFRHFLAINSCGGSGIGIVPSGKLT